MLLDNRPNPFGLGHHERSSTDDILPVGGLEVGMANPWAVLALFTFILAAVYAAQRWLILHTVRHMETMGAFIGWDVDILPSEGGKLDENEPREITRIRKIVHARPLVFFFSEQVLGSENFASHELRRLLRLGYVKRLVFDRVPVRYEDIDWLSKRLKMEELAIYDVCLAENERRVLECSRRYRFTYEAPGNAS
ncbi:MAG: hypothetical protein ACTHK7_23725 [Aureliella sp.]